MGRLRACHASVDLTSGSQAAPRCEARLPPGPDGVTPGQLLAGIDRERKAVTVLQGPASSRSLKASEQRCKVRAETRCSALLDRAQTKPSPFCSVHSLHVASHPRKAGLPGDAGRPAASAHHTDIEPASLRPSTAYRCFNPQTPIRHSFCYHYRHWGRHGTTNRGT